MARLKNGPDEHWRLTWRVGFAPLLSPGELHALRDGLVADDAALIQGLTSLPLASDDPEFRRLDKPCTGACALGYAAWRGRGLSTVEQVEVAFAELMADAQERLAPERGINAFFTTWFDETPRAEMVPALLAEVQAEITRREGGQ
jgi:hypothetical protein